jgi:hypothetical protein
MAHIRPIQSKLSKYNKQLHFEILIWSLSFFCRNSEWIYLLDCQCIHSVQLIESHGVELQSNHIECLVKIFL